MSQYTHFRTAGNAALDSTIVTLVPYLSLLVLSHFLLRLVVVLKERQQGSEHRPVWTLLISHTLTSRIFRPFLRKPQKGQHKPSNP
jgi:hypothetical protein